MRRHTGTHARGGGGGVVPREGARARQPHGACRPPPTWTSGRRRGDPDRRPTRLSIMAAALDARTRTHARTHAPKRGMQTPPRPTYEGRVAAEQSGICGWNLRQTPSVKQSHPPGADWNQLTRRRITEKHSKHTHTHTDIHTHTHTHTHTHHDDAFWKVLEFFLKFSHKISKK